MCRKFLFSVLFFIAATTSWSSFAAASGGPFGLGVILGEPTGLTVKYDASAETAYDAGLSFDLSRWILVYGDYQHKFGNIIHGGPSAVLIPYIGVGGVLVVSNRSDYETRGYRYFDSGKSASVALGVRVPFGIEWRPEDLPLDVFAEIAPGITIIPGTYVFAQGGIGARYFF